MLEKPIFIVDNSIEKTTEEQVNGVAHFHLFVSPEPDKYPIFTCFVGPKPDKKEQYAFRLWIKTFAKMKQQAQKSKIFSF